MEKLHKGVEEAKKGQFAKAVNLFKEVLAVIPENLDARRNMAKAYLELNNIEKAKQILNEVLQLKPTDHDAAIFLGNIYARNENNPDVASFFYDLCLQHHPDDAYSFLFYTNRLYLVKNARLQSVIKDDCVFFSFKNNE